MSEHTGRDAVSILASLETKLDQLARLGKRAADSASGAGLADLVAEVEAALGAFRREQSGLREALLSAQTILDTALDGIITTDDSGRIESFNQAAENLFGYTAAEVVGQDVGMLMSEEDRSAYRTTIEGHLLALGEEKPGRGLHMDGLRRGGSLVPLDVVVAPVHGDGRVTFAALVRDVTERKRFEEDLRRERDFAERLLEAAQWIILVLDARGRIIRFNRYTEELTGYRLADVRGRDWFSTFLPERDRERIRRLFRVARKGTHVEGNINPIRTAYGTECEIEWHGRPLRDADGSVIGVLSVGQDVTERRRRERLVAAQHGVARVLAESASLLEATPRVLHALCEGLGWDLGELWHVDRGLQALRWDGMWHVPELDATEFAWITRDAIVTAKDDLKGRVWATGEPLWSRDIGSDSLFRRRAAAVKMGLCSALAFPLLQAGSVIAVLEFFSRKVRDPDAEVMTMLDSLGRQVGDFIGRKRVEERLLQLATIVEASDDAIVGVTAEGGVMGWNRGAEKMYGYSVAEMVGRTISIVIPEKCREEWAVLRARVTHGEVVDHYETQRVRKDGSLVDVSLTVSPIRDGAGNIVGVSSTERDITARKRAEAELHDLQKLAQQRERLADIGAIATKLAHDLGNPLAAVSMQAQLIMRRARRAGNQPVSTVLRAAEQIAREVGRLDALIRDIMTFSREQRLDIKPIAVSRFLRSIVDLWRPVASQRRIRLTVDIPEGAGSLRADEEKLRRVFENLLKNAVEAVGAGPGDVRVLVRLPSPEKIRVSIEDSGSGIPETVQVFRLFETTKTEGTGLGLPIAKQIVLAHGGEIEFSRLDPHGTAFHVELPRGGPAM